MYIYIYVGPTCDSRVVQHSHPQDPEVPTVRILRHLGARHQRRAARADGVSAHGGDDARAPGGSGTPHWGSAPPARWCPIVS